MKRITRRGFLAIGAGAALALGSNSTNAALAAGEPFTVYADDEKPDPADPIAEIPLDVKIGQMLMVGFRGNYVDNSDLIADAVNRLHIGGILLFDNADPSVGNIGSPQQLQQLTATLQSLAATRLFIAVDQEGGLVARLNPRNGFPVLPSEQHLGNLNELGTTRAYAETTSSLLQEHGINMNLAPVVDLNINPNNPVIGSLGRSFSADPDIVVDHSFEVIASHLEKRVFCALKHFPGHGSSQSDSHLGFVNVTNTWSPVELEPYRKIIGWGMRMVIMTAHIFNANLDPDLPATLSYKTITGLLREQLRFDGVIMTDDMEMQAITDYYTFEQAIGLAIKAGVDIITIGSNLLYGRNTVARAIDAISSLVANGEIPPERIDQSYTRIMRLKNLL